VVFLQLFHLLDELKAQFCLKLKHDLAASLRGVGPTSFNGLSHGNVLHVEELLFILHLQDGLLHSVFFVIKEVLEDEVDVKDYQSNSFELHFVLIIHLRELGHILPLFFIEASLGPFIAF